MNLEGKKIGFAITGSFCAFRRTINELKKIVKLNAEVFPIMSNRSYTIDTKYGNAKDFINEIEKITQKKILHTIEEIEIFDYKDFADVMVIAPATGNTIAKLANDITDNIVTISVKAHLKTEKPVILAISTSNGLSDSSENIGKLLNRRNYYFVPFRQDNPITKPRSLSFDPSYLIKTIEYALEGEQIQPILL